MRPRSIPLCLLLLLLIPLGHSVGRAQGLGATPADAFRVPEGFAVDLLYTVPAEEQGSWVSLTVDPQGRLVACDQYGSLYRITLAADAKPQVERLDVEIGMAQGLLFAFDSLYVNVNDQTGKDARPGGIYRLRDTDGDDTFDSVEHLLELNNGGEHGPHALVLSPDGKRIFLCAGNNTFLPKQIDQSRVPRNWSEDHLLGRMPDARGHNADRLAPGGFVASIDPDGKDFELVATGFRNHYDIAFNPLGELFTFDADMEWDVGTPWYRPTRVNHVISGGEFGWRNGTGKWPAYYPDSFGAAVDIGPGSPTGICFGTGAKFPEKFQRALFICDWSYGNIFAVHLEEDGSTYGGTYETFATAAPLPVTDLVVHPEDGALYFAIGGRRTQSALYRIRYVGNESTAPAAITPHPEAVQLRELRHSLEAFHGEEPSAETTAAAVAAAVPQLGHADRGVSLAARVALEHQPLDAWRETVLELSSDRARILGVVALARCGTDADRESAVQALLAADWKNLPAEDRINLLRAYGLCFLRLGEPSAEERKAVIAQLNDSFPTRDPRVNRELATVLVYLQAPGIITRVVAELIEAPSQEDQIYYAMALRDQSEGWTKADRQAYLKWFQDVASTRGGMSFGGFLQNIQSAAVATLSDAEREAYAELLKPAEPRDPLADLEPREFVHQWTVEDLEGVLAKADEHDYDFQAGKQLFAAAQCYKCHRMGVSGGILGPDLTGAGGRFSAKDLAVAIIDPNKEVSDQYAATQFLTDSGQVVVGKVINMNGDVLQVLTNLLDPSSLTPVKRDEIESVRSAPNSMMPSGLVDTLTDKEILDLLGYLRSGGNPEHPLYGSGT
ncbi:c-type cytochrome [Candidatus Laterigemmans baculatus]|uniref:c-type cytochrome n=1 Tax=Candidatus Laterigemmans baculatus TaxID=2770505 RepID=UPI0013DCBCCD|nr:c-type cytochrome [Candidatus Laterigemmans baculatus]